MTAVAGVPGTPDRQQIQAEVDAVLSSEVFSRAPSLAQFLRYVCLKTINGEADQIKEYIIAVEAFGRTPEFDQKADAIVRVEAHRLRKRLKQYYDGEGASDPIEIVIPPGQYVPAFVARNLATPKTATSGIELQPRSGHESATDAGEKPAPLQQGLLEVVPAERVFDIETPPRRRAALSARAVIAVVAVAVLAGLIAVVVNRRGATVPATSQNLAVPPGSSKLIGAGPGEEGIRIAAGFSGPKYVDSLGNTWLGDKYGLGGQVISSPVERILRTRDAALFQARREGDFRYDIPLDPGSYELRLLFAERVFGTGNIAGGGETSRLFHIFANGAPIVEFLDVISDAAGSNTANVRVFKDISPAPDGFLHLRFSPYKENAFVNGIELLPSQPGRMRPVRMVAGDSSVRDISGRLWTADQYWVGGLTIPRLAPVTGAKYPELYRSERYGNFSYSIPVPDGRYAMTLYFAEAWFGPNKPGGGGEGSRTFDVQCNGTTLMREFDVFKTAGAGNSAIEKTFHGLRPNAQGKLMLSFVPVKNYAIVNAIEVRDDIE